VGRISTDAHIRNARGFEPIEAFEKRQCLFSSGPVLDGGAKQPASCLGLAALKSRRSGVNQLLALALTFGNRAARALDVRSRTSVAAIDEQGSGPDVNRKIVVTGKVVIESVQQQLFEARFSIVLGVESGGRGNRVLVGSHEYRSRRSRRRL
jgi:hypothetical protein